MKIIFDTNVVLDVLLDREPFSTAAALLFSKVERGELSGFLCATTITTLTLFEIAPVNRAVLEGALKSNFADFEDSVIHEAALHIAVQALVTRDSNGFKRAKIPVYSPDELLRILELEAADRKS